MDLNIYTFLCIFSGQLGMLSVVGAVVRQDKIVGLWKGLIPVSFCICEIEISIFLQY